MREYINTNLDRPGKKFVSSKELLEYKNIYSLLFREKILNSCKQIMGERFYLIPDFHIHMNLFGSKLKSYKPAWHIDSGSEGNKKYLTEELSDNAVNFIDDNSDNPFFLYLSYNAPHTPLQATTKDLERNKHIDIEKRQTYAAMISSMDAVSYTHLTLPTNREV